MSLKDELNCIYSRSLKWSGYPKRYIDKCKKGYQQEKNHFIKAPFISGLWNSKMETVIKKTDNHSKGRTLQLVYFGRRMRMIFLVVSTRSHAATAIYLICGTNEQSKGLPITEEQL
ncbi:hypothetical protein ACOME3_009940 [Neoechinorhynchus agilis]